MSLLASSSLLAFLANIDPLDHPIAYCAFEFSGQRYDFCPLLRGGARRSVDAGVVRREAWGWRIAYELVFAGGVDGEPTDSEPSCPEGTWVCMTAVIDWSSDEVENKDPSWILTAIGRKRVVTTDVEVVASLATGKGDNSCEFATDSTWIAAERPSKSNNANCLALERGCGRQYAVAIG